MNPEDLQDSFSSRRPRAVVKGAGDLATGVALTLHRAGFAVVMTEIERPTVVRRTVSFAEAVYSGSTTVEGTVATRAELDGVARVLEQGAVPVVVAADARGVLERVRPLLLVDAIIAKRNLGTRIGDAHAVVALGPGFVAGRDAHAVIETRRGHDLARIILEGRASEDTGIPGDIAGFTWQRVVRSPAAGAFRPLAKIGDLVHHGDVLGHVGDEPVRAGLDGVVRGLLHSGLEVTEGFKLADVDPRGDPARCLTVSDKARAIGGSVLTAACMLLGGARFATPGDGGRKTQS